MIETTDECHENSGSIGIDNDELVEQEQSINPPTVKAQANIHLEQTECDSYLEQSFEIISAMSESQATMETGAKDDGDSSGDKSAQKATENGVEQANGDNKPRSGSISGGRRNSFQNRFKNTSNFLSKIQSSSPDDHDNVNSNIPSSIVSAFSSFSSFTSILNSPTNGNNANSLTIETASTSTKLSQTTETREEIFIKKAALERKNLINLTKLIVKDLISSSLLVSRTIDDCQNAIHLNNYFTLIDRVLKHGLKQNILSSKSAGLWSALDSLPKYLKESTLMSESVRSLANTKTFDGKIKAWMRLAMMQKKLPEYFNELLANKSVLLKDVYHDYAFMLNDEAHVFAGLIIGVNVIDCNYFVKDANFDLMDDIIDLSPYLRIANSYDDEQGQDAVNVSGVDGIQNLTAVLDQKNYLEEWGKRLESTINDMQSKIKSLEEQNSKLEMEAKVSEARILKLQAKCNDNPSDKQSSALPGSSITGAFKNLIGHSGEFNLKRNESASRFASVKEATEQTKAEQDREQQASNMETKNDSKSESEEKQSINQMSVPSPANADQASAKESSSIEVESNQRKINELEKELASLKERASILEASYRGALEKIKILERDLDVQTSMNADKETTIKIYEKDIREKQSQVESLRTSLNDSKKLNADLNKRLNDTSTKLKDRIKSVSTLQATLDKWKLENKTLASRLHDKQVTYKSTVTELEEANKVIESLKKYNEKINEELKMERETGQSSSVTVETQTAKIAELTSKLIHLENELNDAKPFKDQTDELSKRCQEYEQSLEEVGVQLRESQLELENLKENSAVFLDSQWMDSKQVKICTLCQQSFSVTRRKHHCRLCGNVFCQTCSDNKMELASSAKPVRVCDTCHSFLLAKFVKSSTQQQ